MTTIKEIDRKIIEELKRKYFKEIYQKKTSYSSKKNKKNMEKRKGR